MVRSKCGSSEKKFDSFIFFFCEIVLPNGSIACEEEGEKRVGGATRAAGGAATIGRGAEPRTERPIRKKDTIFSAFFLLVLSFFLRRSFWGLSPLTRGQRRSARLSRRSVVDAGASLSRSLSPPPPPPPVITWRVFLRVRVVVFFGTSDAVERTVRQPRPYRRRRQQREQRRDVFFSKKNLLDRPSMGVLQGDSPTPGPAMYWVSPPLWCHPFWVVAKKNWTTHEFWNFCGATVEHRRIVPTFDATLEKRLLSLAWGEGNHWNRPSAERLEQSALGRGNRVWTMWRWNRTDFFFFLVSFDFVRLFLRRLRVSGCVRAANAGPANQKTQYPVRLGKTRLKPSKTQ